MVILVRFQSPGPMAREDYSNSGGREMPSKFRRLKKEAIDGVKFRGHQINFIETYSHNEEDNRFLGIAKCKDCGMAVVVDTSPPPNGIDISGEAVALTCKGKKNE
jgi:hypothetical protein